MSAGAKDTSFLSMLIMGAAAFGSLVAAPLTMLKLSGSSDSYRASPIEFGADSSVDTGHDQEDADTNSGQKRQAPKPDKIPTYRQFVDEFLASELSWKENSTGERGLDSAQPPSGVERIIVTIPDPLDASGGHVFDARCDSIVRAFDASSYVFCRAYLPWSRSGESGRSATGSGTKFLHRHEPGVLIFKRVQKTSTQIVVVYLVGESATAGIHSDAFQNAVNEVPAQKSRSSPIQVIGPSFTGAADSLASAIARASKSLAASDPSDPSKPRKFRVICGSANGVDWERFESLSAGNATFFCTRRSSRNCWEQLARFVVEHDLSNQPIKIAWLRESSSFGKATAPAKTKGTEGQPQRGYETVLIPFPVHISQVREELSRINGHGGRSLSQSFNPADSQLAINRLEGRQKLDSIPTLSSVSPALAELQLRRLLGQIQEMGCRYVAITATNPLDTAFLVELIRSHCPDMQLLLVNPSTSYLHPSHRAKFRGALVVSSYPLDLETQQWKQVSPIDTGSNSDRLVTFDSDGTVGFYNAIILSLVNREAIEWKPAVDPEGHAVVVLKGPGKDEPIQRLANYRMSLSSRTDRGTATRCSPAIWISAIGQSNFVPLRVVRDSPNDERHLISIHQGEVQGCAQADVEVDLPLHDRILGFVTLLVTAMALVVVLDQYRLTHAGKSECGKGRGTHQGRWWPVSSDQFAKLLIPIEIASSSTRWISRRGVQLIAELLPVVLVAWLCAWMLAVHFAACDIDMSWVRRCVSDSCDLLGCVVGLLLIIFFGSLMPPSFLDAFKDWLAGSKRLGVSATSRIARWTPAWFALCALGAGLLLASLIYAQPIGNSPWLGGKASVPLITGIFGLCCVFWSSVAIVILRQLLARKSGCPALLSRCCALGTVIVLLQPFCSTMCDGLDKTEARVRLLQITYFTNGISLVLPVLAIGLAFAIWSWCMLRRLHVSQLLLGDLAPWTTKDECMQLADELQTHSEPSPANTLQAIVNRLKVTSAFIQEVAWNGCRSLRRNFPIHFVLVFSILTFWLAYLARWSATAFESRPMTLFIELAGGVALLAWAHTFWQAIYLRKLVERLLKQIGWVSPLLAALKSLPQQTRSAAGSFLTVKPRRVYRLRLCLLHAMQAILQKTPAATAEPSVAIDPKWAQTFVTNLEECPAYISASSQLVSQEMRETRELLSEAGNRVWLQAVETWDALPPEKFLGTPTLPADRQESHEAVPNSSDAFLAMQTVSYLSGVLSLFYGQIWFLMGMTGAIAAAAVLWPVQPQREIGGTVALMVVGVAVFCVNTLLSFERDNVYSTLRGTTPGRVDFDREVVIKLITPVAPAALFLMSYIFPGFMPWVLSFFEPAMRSS